MWMDKSRGMITDKYLPFCVLSVGIVPVQVSAFMYGMFVGKALEKHGLSIKSTVTKVEEEEIMAEMERMKHFHNDILGNGLRDSKEKPDDGETKSKR